MARTLQNFYCRVFDPLYRYPFFVRPLGLGAQYSLLARVVPGLIPTAALFTTMREVPEGQAGCSTTEPQKSPPHGRFFGHVSSLFPALCSSRWDSSLRLRPVELHPASGHECSSLEDISLPAPLVIALSFKLEKHANYCVEFAVFVSTDLWVERQSPPTCSAFGRVELETPPTIALSLPSSSPPIWVSSTSLLLPAPLVVTLSLNLRQLSR